MTPLEELLTRTIDDGTDRLEWLRARQGRITASMVGKLHAGGASARREILEESFKPPVEITGNKYIDRGHEREPIIARWVEAKWPGLKANVALYGAANNMRHAATPDGIGLSPQGTLSLAEIKTSKYDRHPDSAYFAQTGYGDQMQWQMYVTGAEQTLFVWEQHDDDWDAGPTPLYDEPRWVWVDRDQTIIDQLVAVADLALAERDRMAAEAEFDTEPEVDEELERLATEVLDARRDEAAAKARLKTPWTRLLTEVESREEFSRRAGRAMVTWSNRTVTEWKPDTAKALAAPVEGLEGVTGADLYADLSRAQEAWDRHQALHVSQVERQLSKLTVTEPKPKAADYKDGEF